MLAMPSFVPLLRPDGSTVYVSPETVQSVSPFTAGPPPQSFLDFIGQGLEARQTVDGDPATIAAAFAAGFVPLTLTDGAIVLVNPSAVRTIAELSPGLTRLEWLSEGTSADVTVLGAPAAIAAALASGGGGLVSGSYAPTLASAPIAPILNVFFSGTQWQYIATATGVFVWGEFELNWAGAGVGIVLCNPPPGLGGAPLSQGLGATDAFVTAGLFPIGVDFRGTGAIGELSWEVYNNAGSPGTKHSFAVWYPLP